jgi:hypothetical protein
MVANESGREVVGICFWHFSPVPTASSNVGYSGHTGKHLLIARFSHFDPEADIRISPIDPHQCAADPPH